MSKVLLLLIVGCSFAADTLSLKDGRKIVANEDKTWNFLADTVAVVPNPNKTKTCSDYTESYEDRMSGRKGVIAKIEMVATSDNENGIFFMPMYSHGTKGIAFSMKVVGTGCIEKGSEILFLFNDNTRLNMSCDSKFNCDGNATIYFGDVFRKQNELSILSTKKIKAVRVRGMSASVEEDLTDRTAEDLLQTMKCLSSNIR